MGAIIGRGSYSIVRVCRNGEGRKFAIKSYSKVMLADTDRRRNLEREVEILDKIQHVKLLKYV
jgi:MAP/microtubule affinity-regulating kinase